MQIHERERRDTEQGNRRFIGLRNERINAAFIEMLALRGA
jgi:hypothetical protein